MSRPPSAGLIIPLRASLKGRVRWRVLDERGIPEVPRAPSGVAVAGVAGVEQPNLITDLGLERIADLNVFAVAPGAPATWRRRLAAGTGSTAPNAADTTLDNEVERAATSGTFSDGSTTYELDTTDNVWRAESLVTRLVTMTATRNVTEYGLANAATDDILIRELLRDGGGTPITVSIPEGKSLRVDHTLTVEIPAPAAGNSVSLNVEQYDISDTLVSTTSYDVTHGGHIQEAATEPLELGVFWAWNPSSAVPTALGVRVFPASVAYARVAAFGTSDRYPSSDVSLATTFRVPYVPGSRERTLRGTVPVGSANFAWYGYYIGWHSPTGTAGRINSGWMVRFDNPSTLTKVDTDTLRVGFVSSWDRA